MKGIGFFSPKKSNGTIERNPRERGRDRERERAGTEQEKDKYLLPVQAGFVCMPPKPPAGMEMRRKDETYDVSCWNNNRGRCGSWNGNVVYRSRLNGLHYRSTAEGVRTVFLYGALGGRWKYLRVLVFVWTTVGSLLDGSSGSGRYTHGTMNRGCQSSLLSTSFDEPKTESSPLGNIK